MGVAAGLQQILVGLLDFVPVQLRLGLGEFEAILDRGLVRVPGGGERRGEALDVLVIAVELLLRALQALLDAEGRGT